MSAWSTNDLPDLTGRVALVTGGNSGIGYWTSLHLARKGAHVVLGCRSMSRAEAAVAELKAAVPSGRFEILQMDLGDLASVRAAAETFRARHARLDLLFNNAGIALMPMARTKDGFESHFGANHLGHFALTGLLIDRITATPNARVVHVGSVAHKKGRIDHDDPNFERRAYEKWTAYQQSKLATMLFMLELERRFRRSGSSAISVGAHPGFSGTNISQAERGKVSPLFAAYKRLMNALVLNPPEAGAGPSLLAATAPDAGGRYYGPGGWMEIKGAPAPAKIAPAAQDEAEAARVWALSERLTGVRFLDL
ncbi:MAG TPA: oxidoreductase [Nevskiaceae bacterium]|nr:oxidoreductase [Nevskiaceae bacterium]